MIYRGVSLSEDDEPPGFAEEEAEEPGDEAEKPSYADYSPGGKIVDGIADGICAGIETVTDVLCAPFERLTDKLNGW